MIGWIAFGVALAIFVGVVIWLALFWDLQLSSSRPDRPYQT